MSDVVIVTFSPNQIQQVRYLGPYQIAWYIRQNGFDTQVLDFLWWMSAEQRMNLYKKFITTDTKILGFAPFITSKNLKNSGSEGRNARLDDNLHFLILNEIAENFPWLKIIIGGPFAENFDRMPTEYVNCKIDAIFIGQGEYTFLEYCKHVFHGAPHPPYKIKNDIKVISWEKEYEIAKCRMRFEEQDFILENESLPLQLARGCIFKCSFCQYELIGKKKDDFNRSIDLVKESILYHYEKFGTTRYTISDDTLNAHRQRTKDFYEMTKSLPFDIEFLGYVRMDLLDVWPEQQDILVESGMKSCHFGVESLHPESCKQITKGWGAKNHKRFLDHLVNKWGDDVVIRCSLIAGLGPETEKDWQSTEDYFKNSGVQDWTWAPLGIAPYHPLSEFDKNYKQYGYRFPDPDNQPRYWETDYTNRVIAKEWCYNTMKENYSLRHPGTWYYAFYKNIGFTSEELKHATYEMLDINKNQKTRYGFDSFINAYYNKAMSYTPTSKYIK